MNILLTILFICFCSFSYTILYELLILILKNLNYKQFTKENWTYIWAIPIVISGLIIRSKIYITYPQNISYDDIFTFCIAILVAIVLAVNSKYNPGKEAKDIISFCIVFPVVEEIIFRGILLFLLVRIDIINSININIFYITNVSLPIFICASCFGLMHFQYHKFKINSLSIRQVIIAFIAGIFLGKFVIVYSSIFPSLIMHIAFNSTATIFCIKQLKNKTLDI